MESNLQARTTCLITYSRADIETISTRKKFANAVKDAFNHGTRFSRVLQWACSKERHSNPGTNYHLALKPEGVYGWG